MAPSQSTIRLALPLFIIGLYWVDPSVRAPITTALSDAYLAVGVFVAATLWLFYQLEHRFQIDTTELMRRHALWQIPIAALLGALPGCGGAIIVVSQYAQGAASFAALVTVLIATMGDAAFLLLAQSPGAGLAVIGTGLVVGTLSGLVIHLIHGADFMRATPKDLTVQRAHASLRHIPVVQKRLWVGFFALGLPLGLLAAFQIEPTLPIDIEWDWVMGVGVAGCALSAIMWSVLKSPKHYANLVAEDRVAEDCIRPAPSDSDVLSRVIRDTNFVLVWVACAFLLFELGVHYTGWDLANVFQHAPWAAPLMGILVGFLPGCGPQIIVATLYLNGTVPFSALLGNAISNDGDALFPAIALVPKAAIYATIYSAIPAFVVAYLYYFLFE